MKMQLAMDRKRVVFLIFLTYKFSSQKQFDQLHRKCALCCMIQNFPPKLLFQVVIFKMAVIKLHFKRVFFKFVKIMSSWPYFLTATTLATSITKKSITHSKTFYFKLLRLLYAKLWKKHGIFKIFIIILFLYTDFTVNGVFKQLRGQYFFITAL